MKKIIIHNSHHKLFPAHIPILDTISLQNSILFLYFCIIYANKLETQIKT